MKKTKKTKKATINKKDEQTGISYSGKVTLSVKSGNTVLSKKTYKNNGGTELFKFLCFCLAGQYRVAERFRPCMIKLFFNKKDTPIFSGTENLIGNNYDSVTGMISSNTSATPQVGTAAINQDTNTVTYSTTLHFLIPKTAFVGNNTKFNEIGLYSTNGLGTETKDQKYSAVFLLTDKKADSATIEWAPIDTETWTDNFTLVLEWELTLKN